MARDRGNLCCALVGSPDGRPRRLEGSVSALCEGSRISALGVGSVKEASGSIA